MTETLSIFQYLKSDLNTFQNFVNSFILKKNLMFLGINLKALPTFFLYIPNRMPRPLTSRLG
jgi:hypothetical protein